MKGDVSPEKAGKQWHVVLIWDYSGSTSMGDVTQGSVGRRNELNFIAAVRWQIPLSVCPELRCTYILTLPTG
jgi:hypothetical protein